MVELHWPWILILLPLPWLCYLLLRPAPREESALHVPFYQTITELTDSSSSSTALKRRWSLFFLILIWIALLLAASRPRWVGDPIPLSSNARDLMLAVDLSRSMERRDLTLNGQHVDRLTVVKSVLDDFLTRRKGDRLGLILFGSQAYLQAPLTFDQDTLRILLEESFIGMAGSNTAIGDAIGLAIKQLRKRPAKSRVLILLTDGKNTAGQVTPQQAAQLAIKEKIKVYTIGVGAEEMIRPGILGSPFGARRINPSQDLEEETLKDIAKITGGRYFRAKNTEQLEDIYQQLDQLEPVEQEAQLFRPVKVLHYWPLGFALLISLIWAGLILVQSKQWWPMRKY
ncbi:vWA domain-containing protein [Zooshikella harenae]|uniref:VWA domain-containing protein n=1 Tax=Zooshikella harenae TaxID=2827238 RepID=A0ABS5ZBV1_9GAMM|nr:VWA domain-containing protein [Zooshikella harenae]MBU2711358.1 VWA domain-containing protein [Zooshikella harenae]